MKKILLQLDSDAQASVFDAIAAYDAGVDNILQYAGVEPEDVRDLVFGAIFTRGPQDLNNSAVFIGGSNVERGEKMLKAATGAFIGPLQVSVMMDANGCNTTAAAAVNRMATVGDLAGKKVVVLAGTGPVGLRAAAFFAMEGAAVTVTSRSLERAQSASASVEARFGVQVSADAAGNAEDVERVLDGAYGVLCAGAAGIMLLPETVWVNHPTLQVLGDVNAVPPLGIEGIKVHWKAKEKHGKTIFGAVGIGDFKMKIHHRSVERLFEQNDLVLDAEEAYATAKEFGG